MSGAATGRLGIAEIKVILAEALRGEARRILAEQAQPNPRTGDEIEVRLIELEAEVDRLRRASRWHDFEPVEAFVRNAATAACIAAPDLIDASLGVPAMDLLREVRAAERRIENGEDAARTVEPLVARYSTASVAEFTRSAVTLGVAIAATNEAHPSQDMRITTASTAVLLLEFFGDINSDLLTKDRQKEFFRFVAQLPKVHGKTHGRNRYTSEGMTLRKRDEIARADALDAAVIEEVRGLEGISIYEKRALLAERLVKRVTTANVRKHRNTVARIIRAAQTGGGASNVVLLTYKEIDACVASLAPKDDALYVRVTQPKARTEWSDERIAAFFTSPLFVGSSSRHRRWRPGDVIVRDADYWVPLLVVTLGSRIEELLRLKTSSLRRRNDVFCLAIGFDSEQAIKNDDSRRFVPLPQVLLDLGLIEWIRARTGGPSALLFPDAARRSSGGRISDAYGKHLHRLLDNLGVGDFEEDLYALRKTLLSKLSVASVPDGQRKAIAGHRQADVINRHYTGMHGAQLKRALDRAEFGLQIGWSDVHGFPIIVCCSLGASGPILDVTVELDDAGDLASIEVRTRDTGEPVLSATLSDHEGPRSDPGALTSRREAVARAYNITTTGRAVKLPSHPMKRAAVEHMSAMA